MIYLNILSSFLFSFIILFIYKKLNKLSLFSFNFKDFLFSILSFISIFFINPYDSLNNFCIFIGLLLLFYSAIDDFYTKTIDIRLPIIVTIFFCFIFRNPYEISISFLIFLILLIIVKLTDESLMGEGDAYLLLPLILFLSKENITSAIYLSFCLGIVFLVLNLILSKNKNKDNIYSFFEIPFVPSLLFGFIFAETTFDTFITPYLTLFFLLSIPYLIFILFKYSD